MNANVERNFKLAASMELPEAGVENNEDFNKGLVIHCFDESEMNLELQKIFLEKAPICHEIVRRKPRLERGSSVPAVDSYYGTKDLDRVGHASYFIPCLTPSERVGSAIFYFLFHFMQFKGY